MKLLSYLTALAILLLSTGCRIPAVASIQGVWRGEDEAGVAVEFMAATEKDSGAFTIRDSAMKGDSRGRFAIRAVSTNEERVWYSLEFPSAYGSHVTGTFVIERKTPELAKMTIDGIGTRNVALKLIKR